MKLRLVTASLLLAVFLSGCVRMHLTLDLADDDTASGSIVMALSDEVATTLGYEDPADAWSDFAAEALDDVPAGVTTEPYSSGGYTGVVVNVPATPIEQLELGGANVQVHREGDTFVASGGLSEDDLDAFNAQDTDGLDIVYTLSFPGAVIEHNGTLLDSNTVQWTLTDGRAFDMSAIGSAIASDAEDVRGAVDLRDEQGGSSPSYVWFLLGALAIAALAAVAVIVISRRKRRAS